MIERIEWGHPRGGELPGPFMNGNYGRPLRITLHSNSLSELDKQEMAAVAVLRELGHLPEIEVLETKPGGFPHIEIGAPDLKSDMIPVQSVLDGMPQISTYIPFPRQWPVIATHLVGQSDPGHPDTGAMLELILIAQAHCSLYRDILITASPLLLKHRKKTGLREANPRSPLEASQIVGLCLRSRGNYIYKASRKVKMSLSRGLFYWVLARSRLPNMWKYNSACHEAGQVRGDNLAELGESILIRCVRALEARDAIGIQFYMPQNNETRDQTMYHFDYLTLILAGALDAQAIIANSAYKTRLEGPRLTFQNPGFNEALKVRKAVELHSLIDGQRFKDVSTLLYKLRNTIHKAALKTVAYQEEGKPQNSFIMVPPEIDEEILDAAKRLGSVGRWGLSKKPGGTFMEPYSYTTTLVEESLGIINSIAADTDVNRLFPIGTEIPAFSEVPPTDSPFSDAERIGLLG